MYVRVLNEAGTVRGRRHSIKHVEIDLIVRIEIKRERDRDRDIVICVIEPSVLFCPVLA